MVYVKWTVRIVFWLLVGSFLQYTLPQYDIVRIVDTPVRRVDFGSNSMFWAQNDAGQEAAPAINRDVRFIDTFTTKNRPLIYRNEDTGWGWPPYFKVNSSNLQAEARNLVSTRDAPQWVSVRHYGWRNEFMSIYPNAVRIKPVAGPDVRIINWFNIVFLTLLFALYWAVRVRWRRFRRARIDPALQEWGDNLDAAGDVVAEKRGRISRWLNSWRS
jgi:Protein of unknown function (DUF1523)